MANNVLSAIENIVSFGSYDLSSYSSTYLIRINAVGEQLEFYIKDAIAGSFILHQNEKKIAHSTTFSCEGNQNNPPDMIIRGSDAYEIKKIESPRTSLALNSSPPKNKLLASDGRILDACGNCEPDGWIEKDIFYVVGNVIEKQIHYLFFIQGTCYAAEHRVYERVHEPIKNEVSSIIESFGLERGETTEIGRVNRVDPLGITSLRVRGMWQIQNPLKLYEDLCNFDEGGKFHIFALMRKEKYGSFPDEDKQKLEANTAISVKEVKIRSPDNPANLIDAMLITFKEA